MVEDHGEARQRALLQEEKAKLQQAAARLEQLVEEFGVAPDNDPDDEDEDMDHRPRYSPPRAQSEELGA